MAQNILITGAAGFIGGTLLVKLLYCTDRTFKAAKVFAAVRSQEQAESLSKLHVTPVQVDLSDKAGVEPTILENEIDIIVHTAGALDARMASNAISALGQHRRISGNKTYYIHSSVAAMFSEEGGWVFGEVKDTDPILEKEQQLGRENPVRNTSLVIAEEGKAHDVTTLNVALPNVYGRGSGTWRKLSVNIPALVRASIKLQRTHKFEHDGSPGAVHVSDVAALYILLLERILNEEEQLPTGEHGYYFAMAHRSHWWKVMDGLAKGLYTRGLVTEPNVEAWSSYDAAATHLGFPRQFIRAIGTSSIVSINAFILDWKPQWDETMFMASLDDEIQAVQELDTIKASLFDTLLPPEDM